MADDVARAAAPFEARLPCPVCLGVQMEKVVLGTEQRVLVLDHCARCGGVWFEKGEARQLALRSPAELWKHIPPREHIMRPPCHGCGAPLDRDDRACVACGTLNELACPACATNTVRVVHNGLTLDVCERCKGVWFDHAELKSVWSLTVSDLARREPTRFAGAYTAGDVVLESLFWYPGLIINAGSGLASGTGHAMSAIGDASVGGAAEAASGAVEVVGHAAESVFDAIAGIIGSLFDG